MSSLHRIELLMGTGADIDVRSATCSQAELEAVIEAIFTRLNEIEAVFSTYRADSDVTRLGRGEISIDECCDDVRSVLELATQFHALTNGYFDIYAAAQTEPASSMQTSNLASARAIEPSGIVKGWAIEEAVNMLRLAGATDFCVFIGGDMYVAGQESPGVDWSIGLTHPELPDVHMEALRVRDLGVATSGLYARGDHIVSPRHGALGELLSVTVVGGSILIADIYATAAFAMGLEGIQWVASQPGFDVYAVDANGMVTYSQGLNDALI